MRNINFNFGLFGLDNYQYLYDSYKTYEVKDFSYDEALPKERWIKPKIYSASKN
jgi:hypothetical protein